MFHLTRWQDYEKKLLSNTAFQKKAAEFEHEYQLAKSIIDLRLKRHLSQKDLAFHVGTKQPVISRLETGTTKPTISLLERIAKALDAKLIVKLQEY